MANIKIDIKDFQHHFKGQPFLSDKDIEAYLKNPNVDPNENTLRWHIHQLKQSNIVQRATDTLHFLILHRKS